ncbi:MAG: carboxypeptidase regulatory-like domain-containing protein [bacterium]|nr:carboxypeptidase regulatory-like domain-containing protein [bacterium]
MIQFAQATARFGVTQKAPLWTKLACCLVAFLISNPVNAQGDAVRTPVAPEASATPITLGETTLIVGRVEVAEGAPHDPTLRVQVGFSLFGGGPIMTAPVVDGRFRVRVPKETTCAWVKPEGKYVEQRSTGWWSAADPKPVELRSRLKRKVRLRAVREDGSPVEGAWFSYPGVLHDSGRAEIEGQTDADGCATIWLRSLGMGWSSELSEKGHFQGLARICGVSPDGLVSEVTFQATQLSEKGECPSILFQKPARLRFTFSKKYDYGSPNEISVKWESQRILLGGDPLSRISSVVVGPWASESPGKFDAGDFDFFTLPGTEFRSRIATSEGWVCDLTIPALKPGELHEAAPVVLDPGPLVRGVVVDHAGNPLQGARVRALAGWNPDQGNMTFPSSDHMFLDPARREELAKQEARRETVTDAHGRFYFRGNERLKTAPLEVTVGLSGTGSEIGTSRQFYPAVPHDGEVHTLTFAPGGHRFHGHVRDAEGLPIQAFNIQVSVKGHSAELTYASWRNKDHAKDWYDVDRIRNGGLGSSEMAYSDEDGLILGPPFSPPSDFVFESAGGGYEISDYPAGEYTLVVTAEGFPETRWETVELPLSEPLELRLNPPTSLSIRAQDHDEAPHGALGVQLSGPTYKPAGTYHTSHRQIRTGITDAKGRVDFTALEPGTYELKTLGGPRKFLDPISVRVEAGAQATLVWSSYERGILAGRIEWHGKPLQVRIRLRWGYGKAPFPHAEQYHRGFWIDVKDGAFESHHIRTGEYELEFAEVGSKDTLEHLLPKQKVSVKVGESTDLVIRAIAPHRTVKGEVRLHGKPVTNGLLWVSGGGLEGGKVLVRLDVDGRFEVPLPYPGEFEAQLWATIEESGRSNRQFGTLKLSHQSSDHEPVILDWKNPTLHLNFIDQDGEALPVKAIEARRFILSPIEFTSMHPPTRKAESDGDNIKFSHLPPGKYELLKKDSRDVFFWDPLPNTILVVGDRPLMQEQTVTLKHW